MAKFDLFSLKNQKIAFIGQKGLPAEFPGTSGVEFYVEKWAQKLIKQKNQITAYVRPWATPRNLKEYQQIKLVHLSSLNTKHLDALTHSFLASIHVCFTQNNLVWYQAIGPTLFSFFPKLCGKKIITTIHGLDWQRDKWEWWAKWFLKLCEKTAVRFSDELVVVSDDLKNYYQKNYQKKTILDKPKFEIQKTLKPQIITKKYGLKGQDYLLFLGRFVPEKRIDWLIKAYQKIKKPKIKLILAGGESHTSDYVCSLKKLAGNDRNIIFAGFVFEQEKEELLSNCRCFVLPSLLEGSPIALHEALKYQRQGLVSSIQIHQDLAKKNSLITLFEKDNFQDFYQKLSNNLKYYFPNNQK